MTGNRPPSYNELLRIATLIVSTLLAAIQRIVDRSREPPEHHDL